MQLSSEFKLKDLGQLSYFLGVEAQWTSAGLLLTQRKYIHDLLQKAHMQDANTVSTPACTTIKLSAFSGTSVPDPTLYRSIVGGLQYLSMTRPDISFSVNKASQFMHDPRDQHWQAVKRILRYLKATSAYGLLIQKSSSTQLFAYSDSDWAGSIDDRKSTGGYALFVGLARSSTEAEYRALASVVQELQWLQSLLHEIRQSCSQPPLLFCDNLSATYLTNTPIFHSRSRHLEIDFHFVRDKCAQKELQVRYISTTDQLADGFTKPLPKTRFLHLRDKLSVVSPHSQLVGG
ncbi:hypothetical protein K2173_011197 [Erythroxylum novogranatense]|uniref:Reverse transcriptase Ty1/copia-type domain-containing protein n=1 Tax=Erythroxylum novogranatense TaxID=1862640 RepID=A0AAV8U4X7_9ROSI|nr:hypothetical protein K2173_011197 [Erythroxylum novogranatense]